MQLYIDGVLEAQTVGTKGSKEDPPVLCIGRLQNGKPEEYFYGEIDEVRLYSYVLSPEAITLLHDSLSL